MGEWALDDPGPGCACAADAVGPTVTDAVGPAATDAAEPTATDVVGPTRYPCACTPAYSATLARVPESAAVARRLVTSALDAWNLPALRDTATYVVTELVANAAVHARGRSIRVTATRTRECRVRLAVVDFDGANLPTAGAASADDESGRGLAIVAALSETWGVRRMSHRKQVWADVEQKEEPT